MSKCVIALIALSVIAKSSSYFGAMDLLQPFYAMNEVF